MTSPKQVTVKTDLFASYDASNDNDCSALKTLRTFADKPEQFKTQLRALLKQITLERFIHHNEFTTLIEMKGFEAKEITYTVLNRSVDIHVIPTTSGINSSGCGDVEKIPVEQETKTAHVIRIVAQSANKQECRTELINLPVDTLVEKLSVNFVQSSGNLVIRVPFNKVSKFITMQEEMNYITLYNIAYKSQTLSVEMVDVARAMNKIFASDLRIVLKPQFVFESMCSLTPKMSDLKLMLNANSARVHMKELTVFSKAGNKLRVELRNANNAGDITNYVIDWTVTQDISRTITMPKQVTVEHLSIVSKPNGIMAVKIPINLN